MLINSTYFVPLSRGKPYSPNSIHQEHRRVGPWARPSDSRGLNRNLPFKLQCLNPLGHSPPNISVTYSNANLSKLAEGSYLPLPFNKDSPIPVLVILVIFFKFCSPTNTLSALFPWLIVWSCHTCVNLLNDIFFVIMDLLPKYLDVSFKQQSSFRFSRRWHMFI